MDSTARQTSLSQDIGSYLRYQLRGRRGLIAATVVLALPALWLGWPWLAAAGVAPLLIAVAPCAVMCGLGLCVSRACTKSGAGASASANVAASQAQRATADPESHPFLSHESNCADCDSLPETNMALTGAAKLPTQSKEMVQ
ncbi:MAG: hypothetical protein H0T75_14560 [Rhizobiales bacterium]|nr:hypothetical protein [Hyphomicrobiales bacterium]